MTFSLSRTVAAASKVQAQFEGHVEAIVLALFPGLTPAEIVNGVSGRLDEVEYLADTRLASVAAFGGDSRFKAETHEAEKHGLKNDVVIFVQRAVYEDASVEVVVLWQIALSARRMEAIAVVVPPANAAVSPEDEDIAPLIPGDPSGSVDHFLPGVEVARNPLRARLADCPPLPARNSYWLSVATGRTPES